VGDLAARDLTGSGTPELRWTAWLKSARLPALDVRDLAPQDGRFVVVAPHPDDELLGTGGVLHLAARSKRQILIVAVTDGGASHPGSSSWPAQRLVSVRPAESREGLRRMGLTRPRIVRLGFPDGQLRRLQPRIVRRLHDVIERGDVLFSSWKRDGHPDHDAVGHAVAIAARATGVTHFEVPIWAWHWAHPGDKRLPWRRAACIHLDPAIVALKRAALEAHQSQLSRDPSTGRPPVLGREIVSRSLRPFEIVFS
jgi:LmbE family N-acetylglucosaminyl deacetylase